MENLLTIGSRTALHREDPLDLEVFFKESLQPLMKKFKQQLYNVETAFVCSENYTLSKINKAYQVMENFAQEWEEALEERRRLLEKDMIMASPDLLSAMSELSKKYRELENLSNGEMLDNTIDAFMIKMEELDGKISDALGKADKMRERMEEKFYEVAGAANGQIDQLKEAMAYGTKRLLMYHELPTPWQNNEYILTGYRFLNTAADCWYSLFYVHNETGNIWTHLLGFISLFSIGLYELFYSDMMTSVPITDRLVFLVFFLAACKCLMCSTIWHTLSGINNLKVYKQVACLDYVGISVLICASIILCEYYGFYCNDSIRNTYMVATTSLAVMGVSMPFQEWFDNQEKRWLRIAFFVALASSGGVVFAHLSLLRGFIQTCGWMTPVLKSLSCYIAGVIIYGNHFPEKFWPGKFDKFGHSHQFWHLFVCGGIWFNYQAAFIFASTREEFAQCTLVH
ncbi:hemolysin-III related-domain-containing protein [Sporodiniella umbellata]|nr:hemolysin-III related-domain-containing protein [Sporodiniella umbellata]